MSADVSASEIASAISGDIRSIRRRAVREAWPYSERKVRGGRVRLYPVALLPPAIRTQVTLYLANRDAASAAIVAEGAAEGARARLAADSGARGADAAREAGLARFAALPEAQRRRAEIKAELVGYFDAYVRNSGLPRYRALALFVKQYNDGILEVPAPVRAAWPTVSARSVENWEALLAKSGLASLAGAYGAHRKGKGAIDANEALRDFILAMLHDFPHVEAGNVMAGIRARFDADEQPGYRNLQRWIAAWKHHNKQLFEAVKNPDGWRSKYKAAAGNASAAILRLNQRWEMDGTKGDLRLDDGARHTITSCIDVYSRRIKLQVSRTASSAAVAACLRRALLDWGVPEQLGTDNGSDFVSEHMKRVVAGLGIEHDIAPPYTPEHKPFVERAFGTFCRDLLPLLPGFTGHNVADAQAIRSRQSFAQRMMREGGEKIELRMSAEQLQKFCDDWTDAVYGRDPHSGLNGETPFQRAAAWPHPVKSIENERALDVLLLPAPDGGIRTVTKKGIRVDNALFDAPELGGREGEEVRVLYDDGDIGALYVFALDGAFIARAVCPERGDLGVTRRELAARRQAHQKASLREAKAALKAAARGAKTHTIVRDIIDERVGAAAKVVAFRQAAVPHTTPDLDEAALALRGPAHLEQPPVSEATLAMEAKIVAELTGPTRTVEETISAAQAALEAEFEAEQARAERMLREKDEMLRRSVEAEFGITSNGGALPLTPENVSDQILFQRFVDLELSRLAVTPITPKGRYRRCTALSEAEVSRGQVIPHKDAQWWRGYVKTSEYLGHQKLHLDFGLPWLLAEE